MYRETRDVVNKLFCTLKLKNWRVGKNTMMIELTTLTHNVFVHPYYLFANVM